MFKQISIFLAAVALLASCSIKEDRTMCNFTAPVTVKVNHFSISQDDFPDSKATAIGTYNDVKAITLAFYSSSGSEAYKHTQLKDALEEDETFGEFSTTLPLGSYTMVVLGYKLLEGDELSLTSPTQAEFSAGNVRETFAATQVVNVNTTDAVNLDATLDRIVSKLQVLSTDGKTAIVSNVRMTFSAGSKAFNPTTGLATSNTGVVTTVGSSYAVGATTISNAQVFLATDEQTMDVTIETLDSEGNTLFSKTVEDVPFKRNRVTKLTGKMYTNDSVSASSFQLNTDWLIEEDPINF